MKAFYGALALVLVVLFGCQKKEEHTQKPTQPQASESPAVKSEPIQAKKHAPVLFGEPIEPVMLELPTEALPIWREYADQKPTLVLFSVHPFLELIPEEVKGQAIALAKTGSPEEIHAKGSFFRPETLLLPTQTLSGALEAGWFSGIVWVYPSTVEKEQVTLDTFRRQVVDAGFLTQAEGDQLNLNKGVFSGTLRGVPFQAVHSSALPQFHGPVFAHFDLSYFSGLYKNEVATAVYDILYTAALGIFDARIPALGVTISYSTIEGAISLDSRFLASNLGELLRKPEMLDGDMPPAWKIRGEAMYGATMFQESKQREFFEKAVGLSPEDPTALYDLYRIQFEERKIKEALATLDKVVGRDPGYGYAYLDLAQVALRDNNPAVALELLEKAAAVFPENPFIDFQRAEILLFQDQKDQALKILNRLKELRWSRRFHIDVPQKLKELAVKALEQEGEGHR